MQYPPLRHQQCRNLSLGQSHQTLLYLHIPMLTKQSHPMEQRRGPVIVRLSHSIGDMMYLRKGRNMEMVMVTDSALNLSLLALVQERSATLGMMKKLCSSTQEVCVLTFSTRENVKEVPIATSSIVCRKKVADQLLVQQALTGGYLSNYYLFFRDDFAVVSFCAFINTSYFFRCFSGQENVGFVCQVRMLSHISSLVLENITTVHLLKDLYYQIMR